ncbi:hypothetical protein SAMN05216327_102516 [Dyadobacter sp. SG02]|uniref:uberolysin/carnocyclin family circular bacteriocin n=1 Tax=Dyadobacter sp. SG02 TaxID=1855291 RepID=UPI0008D4D230|nr:uberolysin/carnocyclin family circular bacteriocin [Dyadobacter sp. SG02]SEI57023.1 hypothetical protein SAMN05216327_102516 [Dyadobacter sp. SG02]
MHIPSPDEVRTITAITDPAIRNLRITQCYNELSAAFIGRTGPVANWCTFATWASKQAGQSIRREDLLRSVEARLNLGQMEELKALWRIAGELGIDSALQQKLLGIIRNTWLAGIIDNISEAVGRGNRKVFEEIGWEFARFLSLCFKDQTFNQQRLDAFCATFRPGSPPDGQQYLQQAFTHYYHAFFEQEPQLRTELQLLANLEIGFHEQTRLQPEIASSLNAAFAVNKEIVRKKIIDAFFPPESWLARIRLGYLKITGKTSRLDTAIDQLLNRLQGMVREQLTAHLMTLTLPPDLRLSLGKDLNRAYPDSLLQLSYAGLLALLAEIDPTPDSVSQTGAVDWSDLRERIHYIADLFRCYHLDPVLYAAAFTLQQVEAMKAGKLPAGKL